MIFVSVVSHIKLFYYQKANQSAVTAKTKISRTKKKKLSRTTTKKKTISTTFSRKSLILKICQPARQV